MCRELQGCSFHESSVCVNCVCVNCIQFLPAPVSNPSQSYQFSKLGFGAIITLPWFPFLGCIEAPQEKSLSLQPRKMPGMAGAHGIPVGLMLVGSMDFVISVCVVLSVEYMDACVLGKDSPLSCIPAILGF